MLIERILVEAPNVRDVNQASPSPESVDFVSHSYQHCCGKSNKIGAAMTAVTSSPSARSARLGLRATPEQEAVLHRAADVANKSLTDFILDSACLAAQQTLLDQRLFMVSGSQY